LNRERGEFKPPTHWGALIRMKGAEVKGLLNQSNDSQEETELGAAKEKDGNKKRRGRKGKELGKMEDSSRSQNNTKQENGGETKK